MNYLVLLCVVWVFYVSTGTSATTVLTLTQSPVEETICRVLANLSSALPKAARSIGGRPNHLGSGRPFSFLLLNWFSILFLSLKVRTK